MHGCMIVLCVTYSPLNCDLRLAGIDLRVCFGILQKWKFPANDLLILLVIDWLETTINDSFPNNNRPIFLGIDWLDTDNN